MHQRHIRFAGCLSIAVCAFAATTAIGAERFPAGTYAAGNVTATFEESGRFHVNAGETTEVEGVYTLAADRLEISDEKGAWACTKPGEKTGAYHWTYADRMLKFSKIADTCDDRVGSLTGQQWKKR